MTISDFTKLTIPKSVMKDGMIFIWVEKEFISAIIKHLESQGFQYVENVCYVMLNRAMQQCKCHFIFDHSAVKEFNTIDATPAIKLDDYTYLKKAHRSLLMFRRSSESGALELRHQRTGDVVFDWKGEFNVYLTNVDPDGGKPDFYIWRLIEILLPKAMIDPKKFNQEDIPPEGKLDKEKDPRFNLRLVELWAQ